MRTKADVSREEARYLGEGGNRLARRVSRTPLGEQLRNQSAATSDQAFEAEGGTRVDVTKFLSDLYSELDQIEQEIRVLDREAGTKYQCGFEPGLSASELEPFRRGNRSTDRMCWLQ